MSKLSYSGYRKPSKQSAVANIRNQLSPEAVQTRAQDVKARAQAELQKYKDAGVMTQSGRFLGPLRPEGRQFLQNLAAAARTGGLPNQRSGVMRGRGRYDPNAVSHTSGGIGGGFSSPGPGPGSPLAGIQSPVNSPLGNVPVGARTAAQNNPPFGNSPFGYRNV